MNYQEEMEQILKKIKQNKEVPTLLLHCCCAPCSSAVLEKLADVFKITVFYYNPNIMEQDEYQKRSEELSRFAKEYQTKYPIIFKEFPYDPLPFTSQIKDLEEEKEGGKRCYLCYQMRLAETAKRAKEEKFDYFTTTLSISPNKNVTWLNEIGSRTASLYSISYLPADFKKKNGYQRSVELSKEYHLYRQDYCGCLYSKLEKEKRNKESIF